MKSIVVRFLVALVPALLIAAIAYAFLPPWRHVVLEVTLLVAGWLTVVALVRVALLPHPAQPSPFDAALRPRRARAKRLESLVALEQRLELATTAAVHVHFRLRPILREIAAARLARRGVDIDRDANDARRALGADLWELVRDDRARPVDPFAPGVSRAELRTLVDTLEAV